MSEVGDYLWANYFKDIKDGRIYRKDIVEGNVERFRDRMVIVRHRGKIKGVAVYVTLSDETYDILESLDIRTEDVVRSLASQHGPHAHFIIVAAKGYATIRVGMAELKRRGFKTVSWWDPDMSVLHKYKIKE